MRKQERDGRMVDAFIAPLSILADYHKEQDTKIDSWICWPSGNQRACSASFTGTENEAGAAGWGIGHHDGQAYYVCGDDQESVWDFHLFGNEEGRARVLARKASS